MVSTTRTWKRIASSSGGKLVRPLSFQGSKGNHPSGDQKQGVAHEVEKEVVKLDRTA
jgi:hypothetical protein